MKIKYVHAENMQINSSFQREFVRISTGDKGKFCENSREAISRARLLKEITNQISKSVCILLKVENYSKDNVRCWMTNKNIFH